MTVPTTAMRNGDFSGLRDAQGNMIPIYDPLTTNAAGARTPFPGNIIPQNRISPWAREYLKAIPLPASVLATGNGSLPAQDVINDAAQQGSLKLDHHFNDQISLSGVYLFQNSSEPDRHFFPDALYAYPSYQLDRAINVFVLNNTYILNQNTVATFRFGMNTFEDDNSLPYDFDPATLGFDPAFVSQMPVKKFPSVTTTGYQGTGFSGVNNRNYYSYGGNGTITRLAGSHSVKLGADYRIMGVKAENFGTVGGQLHVQRSVHRSDRHQLGRPQRHRRSAARRSLSPDRSCATSPVNNFINYYSVYMQDDWRASDKLTMNYGIRLEHETGLREADNKLVVGFDRTTASPLNTTIPAGVDPLNPTATRQVLGGLIYAGENGASEQTGNPPAIKLSPRARLRVQHEREDGGARRLRAVLGAVGLRRQQLGRVFRHHHAAAGHDHPDHHDRQPVPDLDRRVGQFARHALGRQLGDFVRRSRTSRAPYVHQYSFDLQRELGGNLSGSVAYIGSTGRRLTTAGNVNINQLDPKYLRPELVTAMTQNVANPFFGNPNAGSFATRATLPRNQLLRPFPQFDTINMSESQPRQVAVSRRRDPGEEAHDVVGRQLQLHLQPPVGQPVRTGQLLHLGAGPAEQLHLHRGLATTSIRTRSTSAACSTRRTRCR